MSQNKRGMSERERFEAWARNNTAMPCIQCRITGEYYSTTTQLAWQAWQARCPEGWQCVPKDLREDMVETVRHHHGNLHADALEDAWDDALAVAPKPESCP